MALPVVFAPVMIDGRAMVDGGFVNPLPFDVFSTDATGRTRLTVAIDVSGGAARVHSAVQSTSSLSATPAMPSATDVLAASSQILQRSIVREKLKAHQPTF